MVVCMRTVSHMLMYLHGWLPVGGALCGGSGTFRTWSLAAGSMSREWVFKMGWLAQFLNCSLSGLCMILM